MSLKLAARTLWRRRWMSSLTLAVLALGIGLATAMWSLIDGVLIPETDAERADWQQAARERFLDAFDDQDAIYDDL